MPPEASWTAIRSPRTSTRGVGFLPAALLPGTPCTGGNFPLPICWVCTPETVYGIAYGFFGLRGMPEPAGELIQGAASLANRWKTVRKLPEATGKTAGKLLENCWKTAGGHWQNRWKTAGKLPEATGKTAGKLLENCRRPLAKPLENRWKTAGGHWQNRWKTAGKLAENRW